MPTTRRNPVDVAAAADAMAFDNAAWHSSQSRYWRAEKIKRGPVSAGRCESNTRRHEAKVLAIASTSELVLAERAKATQAPA